MRPRRRLISLSPRYLLTWQCRRLSTVSTPHLWTLLCRRSHTVHFLRTFLRRWVLAQLPRFLLTCLFRLPAAQPHLLLDAATQTSPHCAASADATTQLPLTEFFVGCVYTNDPLDRSIPPPTHGNARSASLPQPIDIATVYSPCSTSRTSGRSAPRARLHSRHRLHQVSRIKQGPHMGSLLEQRPCDTVRIHLPQLRPRSYM